MSLLCGLFQEFHAAQAFFFGVPVSRQIVSQQILSLDDACLCGFFQKRDGFYMVEFGAAFGIVRTGAASKVQVA